MKSPRFSHLAFAGLLLGLSMVLGLWSWNTLGDLFGLPVAQFKHVLAATVGVLSLRWILLPGRPSHYSPRRGHRHE